jgi:hypothetical protein
VIGRLISGSCTPSSAALTASTDGTLCVVATGGTDLPVGCCETASHARRYCAGRSPVRSLTAPVHRRPIRAAPIRDC